MNANTKLLLTVYEIASRNDSLPLVGAGKGRRVAAVSRTLYPSNPSSRPSGILRPGQKTMPMLRLHSSRLCQYRASTILRQYNPHSAMA